MKILLDMDGVLADFDGQCWNWLAWNRIQPDIPDRRYQTAHFVTDHMTRKHAKQLRHYIDTTPFFRDLPLIPGAQAAVADLIDAGHDVWVCTKPLEANPTCLNDKHAWLADHFPELASKLITAPDKSMIHGDVLIDDAPKPGWIAEATWLPIIYDQPYNRTDDLLDLPRITWTPDTAERLTAMVDRWSKISTSKPW